jgi:glycerol-3-phosphate acyltransferase
LPSLLLYKYTTRKYCRPHKQNNHNDVKYTAMVKKPSPFRKSFSPIRRLLRRNLSGRHYRHPTTATTAKTTTSSPPAENLQGQTVIVDVEAWLLRSRLSTFAYFMLVAVEAGGFLRGLLLLLSYPFMCLLSGDMRLRAMVMVTFFGLREKEVARVGKAVLPKLFLEEMAMEGLDAVKDARRVVAVCTLFPRVMAEGFLKEYLRVDTVVGKEVMAVAGRYVGFIVDEALTLQTDGAPVGEEMKEMMNKGKHEEAFGLVGIGSTMNHLFSYYCKVSLITIQLKEIFIIREKQEICDCSNKAKTRR